MSTINTDFPLSQIENLFDKDQFYIKLFRDLLDAVTTGDFSNVSRTSTIIENEFYNIRGVKDETELLSATKGIAGFIMENIYENIYKSDAYDALIMALINIYSVMYTVNYMRKNITDIDIQPDKVVDAYLDEFGFKGKHLFTYIQKREICKVVYWYIRRKGTPALIIKLLDTLGFSFFYLSEYEIYECRDTDEGLENDADFLELANENISRHLYKPRLLYEEKAEYSSIGFYNEAEYTYNEIKAKDPLCIKEDAELTANNVVTYPVESAYYQIGVAVSYSDLEKMISAFIYAVIKKTYLELFNGADSTEIYKSTVTGYKNKVSIISLVLGWSYVLGEYFGVRDSFLFKLLPIIDDTIEIDDSEKDIYNGQKIYWPDREGNVKETRLNDDNPDNFYINIGEPKDDKVSLTELNSATRQIQLDLSSGNELKSEYETLQDIFDHVYLLSVFGTLEKDFSELSDNLSYNISQKYTYINSSDINKVYPINYDDNYKHDISSDTLKYNYDKGITSSEDSAREQTESTRYYVLDTDGGTLEDIVNNFRQGLYSIGNPVFGWTGDVENNTILDILHEIRRKIKELNTRLLWWPSKPEWQKYEEDDGIPRDTILQRKDKILKEIYDTFYVPAIFNTYDNAIKAFVEHDDKFKQYIDSIILTKQERMDLFNNGNDDDIAINFDNVITLLDNILESIEYYIFDNTTLMIPVRNLVLSYSKVMYIINEIDKYYSPYQAKLINPMIIWMIRDLPGDMIAVDAAYLKEKINYRVRDVVWRADHMTLSDIEPADPYAPIDDWTANGKSMKDQSTANYRRDNTYGYNRINYNDDNIIPPHIPISSYYLDDLYYPNSDELQLKYPLLYSVGYDWRDLKYNNFIVRSKPLEPRYDFDPDIIKTDNYIKMISAFNVVKPDHEVMRLMKLREEELESRRIYMNIYKTVINANSIMYNIKHDLNEVNVIVEVYDNITGKNLQPRIIRTDRNRIQLEFDTELSNESTVLIFAPYNNISTDQGNRIGSALYNLYGNGRLKHFMIRHEFYTDDLIIEVYNRTTGKKYNCNDPNELIVRRINNELIYVLFNKAPSSNDRYRINVMNVYPQVNNNLLHTLYYAETVSPVNIDTFVITHNFHNNNFISRVFNINTGVDEPNAKIIRLDNDQLVLDLSDCDKTGNYRILLLGNVNRNIVSTASPLNNITAFSGILKGNGESKSFLINHKLGTTDTFEQIFDYDTGENIRVLLEHTDNNNSKLTFFEAPQNNKRYIVNIFGQSNMETMAQPSAYYNTFMKQYKLVSNIEDESSVIADYNSKEENNIQYVGFSSHNDESYDYIINHNFNSESILAQLFDSRGFRVECNISIVNKNTIIISLSTRIPNKEVYTVNVLSLPDPNVSLPAFTDYNNFNLINMYVQRLPADCIKDTFTVRHSMRTTNILVNVFNKVSKETVNTYVAINDENNVTIGFKDALGYDNYTFDGGFADTIFVAPDLDGGYADTTEFNELGANINKKEINDNYYAVIIGSMPSNNIINTDTRFDIDSFNERPPHHYQEIVTLLDRFESTHKSFDYDHFDSYEENIKDPLMIADIYYNSHRIDFPQIRERVDIIHELKNREETETNNITYHSTELAHFNTKDILTNDEYFGYEPSMDVAGKLLPIYQFGLDEERNNIRQGNKVENDDDMDKELNEDEIDIIRDKEQ